MNAIADQIMVDRCNLLENEVVKLRVELHLRAGLPMPPSDFRIAAIINGACLLFDLTPAEIIGECRCQQFCRARFAVAWVSSKTSGHSLGRIGRNIGNRDHTTILAAIRRCEELRAKDEDYRLRTDELRAWFTPKADQEQAHAGNC